MPKVLWPIRSLIKANSSGAPTVAPSNDHTDGTWATSDIYERELFLDASENSVYTRNPVTDEIVKIWSGQSWTLVQASAFTATPASATTVTFSTDYTDKLKIGDVVKVKLTGITDPVFCYIEDVTSTLLTVSGVPLSANIEFMWFSIDNKARIQSLIIPIRNEDDFWNLGESRPAVSVTPGATPTVPSNPYGTNIFWGEKIDIPFGSYLVRAKVALKNCGSSVTPGEIEIGFSGQAAACSIELTTQENYALSIDRNYYKVISPAKLDGVNVLSAGGNLDIADACIQLHFFIDASV